MTSQHPLWKDEKVIGNILVHSLNYTSLAYVSSAFYRLAMSEPVLTAWLLRNINTEKWKIYQPITSGADWIHRMGEMENRKTPVHLVLSCFAQARHLILSSLKLKPNSGIWGVAVAKRDVKWLNECIKNPQWLSFAEKHPLLLRDAIFMCVSRNLTDSDLFSNISLMMKNSPYDVFGAVAYASQLNNSSAMRSILAICKPAALPAFETAARAYLRGHKDHADVLKPYFGKFATVWDHFLKVTEGTDDQDFGAAIAHIQDECCDFSDTFVVFQRVLCKLAIKKGWRRLLAELFKTEYYPDIKYLLYAFFLDDEKTSESIIEHGIMFGSEILASDTPIDKRTLLLLRICGATIKDLAESIIFVFNSQKSVNPQFEKLVTIAILRLLESIRHLAPKFQIPPDIVWNAMTVGNVFVVDLLQKQGAAMLTWMESQQQTEDIVQISRGGKTAVLPSSSLGMQGGRVPSSILFVQSAYSGQVTDYGISELGVSTPPSNGKTYKWESDPDVVSVEIQKKSLRVDAPKPKPLSTSVQEDNVLWTKVLTGQHKLTDAGEVNLSWMEPREQTPVGIKLSPLQYELESQPGLLRAFGGLYSEKAENSQ